MVAGAWSAGMAEPAFWRAREPTLHIEALPAAQPRMAAGAALERLMNVGYFRADGLIAPAQARVLAGVVRRLRRAGWPLELAWVYDELWQLAGWARAPLAAALGDDCQHLALAMFWVDADRETTGWAPHRDRRGSLLADGRLRSLTAWLALTEATPDNGCVYVLPAHLDPAYRSGDQSDEVVLSTLQDVRALPARPGTLLMWTHELLHWGGRSSGRARGPRISMGIEFVRAATPYPAAMGVGLPGVPPFRERLRVIADSILRYQRMRTTPPGWLEVADAIQKL